MEYTQSLVEHAHITEMQEDLRRKLNEAQRKDLGRLDSLRSAILQLVVGESYERAVAEMEAYVSLKTAYPGFQERAERYVQHCAELIQAIQTKRNFPGLASLSLAKQQEIHDKVIDHFEELKSHLKQIEQVERESKLNDVRSTVWVMRSVCHGIGWILLVAFLIDARNGAFGSFLHVSDYYIDTFSIWIANLLHI